MKLGTTELEVQDAPITAEERRRYALENVHFEMTERGINTTTLALLLRAEGSKAGLSIDDQAALYLRVADRMRRGDVDVQPDPTDDSLDTAEVVARLESLKLAVENGLFPQAA